MTFPATAIDPDRFASVRAPDVPRQRGAYALVLDEGGRVLVVQASNGRFYLPGGRIEPGETATDALRREMAEECGWDCTVGSCIGQQEQSIFDGAIRLSASYWRARLGSSALGAGEHQIHWLDREEAARRLHRKADRWAVACCASREAEREPVKQR